MPITRPIFLKTPLSFTLSSLLFYLAKHSPFSPSPPLLFFNLNKTIIRICSYNGNYKDIKSTLTLSSNSLINFNIKHKSKPLFCFFCHTNYLPYFINTSIYIYPCSARQPLISALRPLVPLHTFSQNETTRSLFE